MKRPRRTALFFLLGSALWARPEQEVFAETVDTDHVEYYVADNAMYDDNLYSLNDNVNVHNEVGPRASRGDYINSESVGLNGQWSLGRQILTATLRADDNQFSRNDSLNYISGASDLAWNWRSGDYFSGQVGGDYARTLANFAQTQFYSKDILDTDDYFATLTYAIGPRWYMNASARHDEGSHSADALHFDDFGRNSGKLGVEYETPSLNTFGLDYRYSKETLAGTDLLGGVPLNRDYKEDYGTFRTKYALTGKTDFQGNIGYVRRTYLFAKIGNFSGDVWRAALQWQATVKTGIQLSAWRELQSYLDEESDYFVGKGVGIGPTWAPTAKLALSLQGSWEDQHFIGPSTISGIPGRVDRVEAAAAKIVYIPIRALEFSASYRLEKRDSNEGALNYHDNVVIIGAKFRFGKFSAGDVLDDARMGVKYSGIGGQ